MALFGEIEPDRPWRALVQEERQDLPEGRQAARSPAAMAALTSRRVSDGYSVRI
jgi:hypothetical protein